MSVRCSEVISFIESIAPLNLAEDWDNVGMMLGGDEREVNKIIVCLSVTSSVADEAVKNRAELIISHHPFMFKGFKRILFGNAQGRLMQTLIKNDIWVYSAHTNLDAAEDGVSRTLADLLELTDIENLNGNKYEKLYKIVVFVPDESVDAVRNAMSRAGAGWIGNYSDCSFMTKGTGTFRPLEGTNPYIGSKGNLEKVDEFRLETIVPQRALHKAVSSMIEVHPYEEVAYDIYPLELKGKQYSFGKIGKLRKKKSLKDFTTFVKNKMGVDRVRVIGNVEEISRVAVFGGSFDESLLELAKQKADVLVTGDVKYHTALEIAEAGFCAVDAGHFATEKIIVPKLAGMLSERFKDVEVIVSAAEEDPFRYY